MAGVLAPAVPLASPLAAGSRCTVVPARHAAVLSFRANFGGSRGGIRGAVVVQGRRGGRGGRGGGRGKQGEGRGRSTEIKLDWDVVDDDDDDDDSASGTQVDDLFNISTGGWSLEAFGEDDDDDDDTAPLTTSDVWYDDEDEDVEWLADLPINQKLMRRIKAEEKAAKRDDPPPPKKAQKLLKVIAGRCSGLKLLSPSGPDTRPMMEVVRGAVFSMLLSQVGMGGTFPPGSRWLDLYAGTASVGIEALSRGCAEAHFIELDPWVVSHVIEPNLRATKLGATTVVHTMKAEGFLDRALAAGKGSANPFDFISVTPPYEAVEYGELMASLARSPLVAPGTFMIVEYPRKSKNLIPNMCGPLHKLRDRKYGRTYVAIYGPLPEDWEGYEDDEDDWED